MTTRRASVDAGTGPAREGRPRADGGTIDGDAGAALIVSGVSKFYNGPRGTKIEALRDVSMEVREGQFVGIVGPSGCGKTTVLGMIAGLIRPDRGEVRVQLPRVNGEESGQFKRSLLFQKDTTLPWLSVKKNLEVCVTASRGGREAAASRRNHSANVGPLVERMLDLSGLSQFAHAYPHHLSGGMLRRLALFQSLITEPDLLMLDEPFGALDEPTRIELHALLLGLPAPRMTILITHDIAEAISLCDVIVVMTRRPGRVRAVYDIDIEKPRNVYRVRETARFGELYRAIWKEIREEILPDRGGGE